MTNRWAAFGLMVGLAVVATGCRDRSGGRSGASATTASTGTGPVSSAASATSAAGPVTEADVAEVHLILRRLDVELGRLESELAVTEGEAGGEGASPATVTRRLLAVRALTAPVKAMTRIGEPERAELTAQLQEQVNGLTALSARIQGASDEATVRANVGQALTDYRVYALTIPKVRGVVVADLELHAADRLRGLADRLAITIDRRQGRDTGQAGADLAALRARLAAVTDAVSVLPAGLVALDAAGYPDNRTVLEQARQALRTGRASLADAAVLARAVIAELG